MLNICLGWCGANSLMVLGFYFSGDILTILSASENSRSLMGGSDVVHCVRVLLTGTTVAEFWVWEFGWDWFMYIYLLCVQYRGH